MADHVNVDENPRPQPQPGEPLFKPVAEQQRRTGSGRPGTSCSLCGRQLAVHELPRRGLPGLCDDCARANAGHPFPAKPETT